MEKKGKTGLRSLAVRNWQDRDYLGFIAYACVCLAWNFGRERVFEAGFAELGVGVGVGVGVRLTTGVQIRLFARLEVFRFPPISTKIGR